MDLNSIGKKLASNVGVPMHLNSPDGFPLFAYQDGDEWHITVSPDEVDAECFPSTFTMIGIDSAAFRRRKAELFRMAQSNKKLKFNEADMESLKTASAGMTGWSHIVWNDDPEGPNSKGYLIEFTVRTF